MYERPSKLTIPEELKKAMDSLNDNDYTNGWLDAVNNILGHQNNSLCEEDCHFSDVQINYQNSLYGEGEVRCTLKKCWITQIRELIRSDKNKR